jgi:hypothetical protein
MDSAIKDKHILFSIASVCVVILVCTVGSFNTEAIGGNGMTELEGIISDPSPSQNGTVFTLTDLDGNAYKCFYRSKVPETPTLCKVVGSFSADGNIFFVDRITFDGKW